MEKRLKLIELFQLYPAVMSYTNEANTIRNAFTTNLKDRKLADAITKLNDQIARLEKWIAIAQGNSLLEIISMSKEFNHIIEKNEYSLDFFRGCKTDLVLAYSDMVTAIIKNDNETFNELVNKVLLSIKITEKSIQNLVNELTFITNLK